MDQHLPIYGWLRDGASILTGRVAQVDGQPGPPGQQELTIRVQIKDVLFGPAAGKDLVYKLLQPQSQTARLKFPDPVWGRVDLDSRPAVLLVVPNSPGASSNPLYVEPIPNEQDPSFRALLAVLEVQRSKLGGSERAGRYLAWLKQSHPTQILFAAEALAKDPDIPGIVGAESIGAALAEVFLKNPDPYVRISAGTWMWDSGWKKSDEAGRLVVVNSTIAAVNDRDRDVRRFSIEQLTKLNDKSLTSHQSVQQQVKRLGSGPAVSDPTEAAELDAMLRRLGR